MTAKILHKALPVQMEYVNVRRIILVLMKGNVFKVGNNVWIDYYIVRDRLFAGFSAGFQQYSKYTQVAVNGQERQWLLFTVYNDCTRILKTTKPGVP